MKLRNSFFALAFIGSSVVVAHNHHGSTKEELLVALICAEKVNENLAARNENLKAQVACLKAEIKHLLPAHHRFHELIKALEHLEKAVN